MVNLRKRLKNLTVFDYILITIFLFGVIVFAYIFFRTPKYITATVKVGEENIVWPRDGVRDWFGQLFNVGMAEKDGLGNLQAEVTDVYSYDVKPNKKAVYLTLKIRVVYTKASNQHTYKGKPVLVGQPIKLRLDSLNVEGLITNVEGAKDLRQREEVLVEARLWNESSTFLETTGVNPYVADAINVGDEVRDSFGNIIITVLEKKVENAKRVAASSAGRVTLSSNPLLKDVYLTLKISATKINDRYYLFDDVPILIGEEIPFNLENLSVQPMVTKITPLRQN